MTFHLSPPKDHRCMSLMSLIDVFCSRSSIQLTYLLVVFVHEWMNKSGVNTKYEWMSSPASELIFIFLNKKHLKNVGPIRHNEPPHANSPDVASGTVVRRLRIDVYDNDDDNTWQGTAMAPWNGPNECMHRAINLQVIAWIRGSFGVQINLRWMREQWMNMQIS